MNQLQYCKQLKDKDVAMTNLFDTISTVFSLRKSELEDTIVFTQSIGANIEARRKKSMRRYIKLLDFIEQYKEEEEVRAMIDLDFQIIKKNFVEIKQILDGELNMENLTKSNKSAIDILKSYNAV